MFLSMFKNNISTFALDTNGLQDLIDNVSSTITSVFIVLISAIALAAIVVSATFFIRAGFSSDPEKRKKYIIAIVWLWAIVAAIAILWGIKEGIIAIVQNSIK